MLATQTIPFLSLIDSVVSGSAGDREKSLVLLEGQLPEEKARARKFTVVDGEAEQAVRIGILEAARSYRPDKGTPFLPYLRIVVRRAVDKATRPSSVGLKVVSDLDHAEYGPTGRQECEESKAQFKAVEDRILIEAARALLTPTQNEFLDALIEHDFNASDAARSMGLTCNAGHKMLERIRDTVQASALAA